MIIYVLEGTPGSGKSTGLGLIQEYFTEKGIHIGTVSEPVQSFEHFDSGHRIHKPFELFHKDPRGTAASIQHYISSCLENHYRHKLDQFTHTKPKFIVCDRYIDSSTVFSLTLHKLHKLSDFDLDTLSNRLNSYKQNNNIPTPAIRFLLDVPVELCAERIRIRARRGESDFTDIPYLQTVYDCHDLAYGHHTNYVKVKNVQELIQKIEDHQLTLDINTTPKKCQIQ